MTDTESVLIGLLVELRRDHGSLERSEIIKEILAKFEAERERCIQIVSEMELTDHEEERARAIAKIRDAPITK